MKKYSVWIVIASVLAVAAVIAYAVPESGHYPLSGMMGGRHGSQMDKRFIEGMIPHHEDAIAMAKLALTEAEHPEIKGLAESIISSQSAEIEKMRNWYQEWYGVPVPEFGGGAGMGMMNMGMMGDDTDLENLKKANPFDKEFIDEMIPHHQMALMMIMMIEGSDRPEMRQLAKDIHAAQSGEIDSMRSWYREWYQ